MEVHKNKSTPAANVMLDEIANEVTLSGPGLAQDIDVLGAVGSRQGIGRLGNAVLAPPVAVSVNPTTIALNSGQTAQLTPMVTNTASKGVTWSISPVGLGSITASGLYTAPAIITAALTVTVTATSLADTTASSSTTITLQPPVAVSVTPATISLNSGQTAQLTAGVINTSNLAVTWSVSGGGTISTGGMP